jgi:hypothetical protein
MRSWPGKRAVIVVALALGAMSAYQPVLADEAAIVSSPDNELNLRDGPNADAAIITKLLNNTKVHITTSFPNGWQKIVVDIMGDTGNRPESPLAGFVNGKYLITETVTTTSAFRDGRADRQAWEAWVGGLGSTNRAGAEFWAGHRSDPRPPDCGSTTDVAFQSGCEEAKKRLDESDRRRRADADYRAGWNSPLEAISTPTTIAQPVSPPPASAPSRTVTPPKPAAPVQNDTESTAPADNDYDTYVCSFIGEDEPSFKLIITSAQNGLAVIQQTPGLSIQCTSVFRDGRYEPLFVGSSSDFCTMLTGNPKVHQSVKVHNRVVTAKGIGDDGTIVNSFDFDTSSGILEHVSGRSAECHRAHL